MSTTSFIVDAALFDMVKLFGPLIVDDLSPTLQDGTLVDSIPAVEAAWGKVADELGWVDFMSLCHLSHVTNYCHLSD